MNDLIIISGIFFLSACVMGLTGFGFGMLAIPLLSSIMSPKDAIPLSVIFSWTTNTILLLRFQKSVETKMVGKLMVGIIIGVPVGVFFLKSFDDTLLRILLGVFTIFYVLNDFFNFLQTKVEIPEKYSLPAGILSGLLSGGFGFGALPVLIFVSAKVFDKEKFKGTLHYVWLITLSFMLISLSFFGLLHVQLLSRSIIFIPFVISGILIGNWAFGKINQSLLRKIILGSMLVVGLKLLIKP